MVKNSINIKHYFNRKRNNYKILIFSGNFNKNKSIFIVQKVRPNLSLTKNKWIQI